MSSVCMNPLSAHHLNQRLLEQSSLMSGQTKGKPVRRHFASIAGAAVQAERPMDRMAWSAYQKIRRSWMSKDIKIMNLSTIDLASRFNTAIALYIPQQITAVRTKVREWETFGRNVLSWTATLALGMWTKSSDGLPRLIDRWLMSNEKLGFDPQFLLRADGINAPAKGLKWTKLDLNHLTQLKKFADELNSPATKLGEQLQKAVDGTLSADGLDALEKDLRENRFSLKNHEYVQLADAEKLEGKHIAVEYAKKLRHKIPEFTKKINFSKAMQIVISTLLFTLLVGQGVMLLVWGTFSRLDSEFDPSKNPLKNLWKRKADDKPKLSKFERFLKIPSRVAFDPNLKAQTDLKSHQAYKGVFS